jgi:hypothetical protein
VQRRQHLRCACALSTAPLSHLIRARVCFSFLQKSRIN